ncbi:alpha/beta fold hydrolase [Shewanella sedimentimangrovi]|nr:alpha/beta fold hydrolase [Shewanella sedimentimangrovi]
MMHDAGMPLPLLASHRLPVGDGHELHLAQYGDPDGVPVLYLHGGPGAGCNADDTRLFANCRVRLLLLDQRGAGQSLPRGELNHNHLQALLADLELVREALGIEAWCLVGGSFGATLGLIYSGLHPERVLAQVYWGLFVPSLTGLSWLYGPDGAARLFDEDYQRFSSGIPIKGWLPLLFDYFHKAFGHADDKIREPALRRWLEWEMALAFPGNRLLQPIGWHSTVLARTELHYARNHYFGALELLQRVVTKITAPSQVLQGEQDWVCPWSVLQSEIWLPEAGTVDITKVPEGFHSLADAKMCRAVAEAIQTMVQQQQINR